jgi:hypothetical protein
VCCYWNKNSGQWAAIHFSSDAKNSWSCGHAQCIGSVHDWVVWIISMLRMSMAWLCWCGCVNSDSTKLIYKHTKQIGYSPLMCLWQNLVRKTFQLIPFLTTVEFCSETPFKELRAMVFFLRCIFMKRPTSSALLHPKAISNMVSNSPRYYRNRRRCI